jgi:hypothetical protein
MPSNYETITKYNEDQLGKDTASRKSQVNMYSDFSHFVFELLQNADDYGATKVSFKLDCEALVIEHDGSPFTEENVRAISYFGKSTSRDDLVKTGRFGLGFKSVFAFTATPIIHSGDENFQLYDLYRLVAMQRPQHLDMGTTQIVLPFNHMERFPRYVEIHVDREKAFNKISERLQKLDITTLLFTRNVFEIKWIIQGKEGSLKQGHYLREDTLKNNIDGDDFRKTTVTDGNSLHTYLIYSRPIKWKGREHKPVDIAFYLNTHGEKEFIQSSKNKLFVLFPTTCETFVGFLMNGPFRTPAHRETVSKDDDFNQFLILQIGELLRQSMFDLKGKGSISVSFLNVLPIRTEDFPKDSMFYPIYVAVRDALINEDLLPADDGTFVSARNAKLARGAELRSLLNQDQLSSLFLSTVSLLALIDAIKWLPGEITEGRSPDLRLYLLEHLKIDEVRPEKFVELLTDDFLENQSDQWIIDFYSFVKDRTEFWEKPDAALKKRKILRLEDNSHVIPFKSDGTPNAYLPSSSATTNIFPTIKRNIFEDETAADFLKKLDIIEPDSFAEIIESILPKYAEDQIKVGKEENIEDLRKIKKLLDEPFLGNFSNLLSKLRILSMKAQWLTYFLERIENLSGNDKNEEFIRSFIPKVFKLVLPSIPLLRASNGRKTEYKFAENIYKNTPELHHYFQGNAEAWFICDDYPNEILSLLDELRINERPKVTQRSPDNDGFVIISKSHGYHRRGLNGFDPDIKVDGIESAITNPTIEKSVFIWDNIALPHSDCIRGHVEKSNKKTYEKRSEENQVSRLGRLLIENAWLPNPNGNFSKPKTLFLNDLPAAFKKFSPQTKDLSLAIGMKQPEREKALEVVTGGDPDLKMLIEHYQSAPDADRKKMLKIIPREILPEPAPSFKDGLKNLGRLQRGKMERGDKKSSPVSNPGRYQEKLNEGVEAGVKEHSSTSRKITFSPRRDLASNAEARHFLYEQYHGCCQIAGTTFPKARGNPNGVSGNYFEACSLLSHAKADYLNDPGNMLCVSADTIAKLKFASFQFIDDLEDAIETFKTNGEPAESVSVKIRLAGEECFIKWSQRHFMRLVALYEKA